MNTLVRTLLILATAAGLSACRTASPRVPSGFVTVPASGDVVLNAVSPDGDRLRVSRHENPPDGTLAFWREAVERELTAGRGYELVESKEVADRGDRPARELRFRVVRPEAVYLYLVVIRIEGGEVVVAEAGGEEESITPDLDALRRVLR